MNWPAGSIIRPESPNWLNFIVLPLLALTLAFGFYKMKVYGKGVDVNTDVWTDRRSGQAGILAGNLVIRELERHFGETIKHRKGTTFFSQQRLYVGRACGVPDYLASGEAHWCNISQRQFDEVTKEARCDKRKLHFVFITATPKEVHYWCVPGVVVARILPRLPTKPSDKSCFLRIRRAENRFYLESEEITKCHRTLKPGPSIIAEFASLLDRSQKLRRRRSRTKPSPGRAQSVLAADVRLQKVFQNGEELAVNLPRELVETSSLSAGSLVQASTSGGVIVLRPVEVIPRLTNEDQQFVDELYLRRRSVFEALAE